MERNPPFFNPFMGLACASSGKSNLCARFAADPSLSAPQQSKSCIPGTSWQTEIVRTDQRKKQSGTTASLKAPATARHTRSEQEHRWENETTRASAGTYCTLLNLLKSTLQATTEFFQVFSHTECLIAKGCLIRKCVFGCRCEGPWVCACVCGYMNSSGHAISQTWANLAKNQKEHADKELCIVSDIPGL